MATKQEVAAWMYQEVMRDGELSQERARSVIIERFGRQFVPGGHIAQIVLKEWQKLTRGKVVWNVPHGLWRLKPSEDKIE